MADALPAGSYSCSVCGIQLHLYASFSAAEDQAALENLGWRYSAGLRCAECVHEDRTPDKKEQA